MKLKYLAVTAVLMAAVASVHAKDGAPSRLFPCYESDTGILRLGQAMQVASRQEILNLGVHYQLMLSTGIPDAQLGDGRMAALRVYCCGGSIEQDQAIWVFVPPGIKVEAGDFVEVRMGRVPNGSDPGVVNTVVAVRQSSDQSPNGPCYWQPDNPKLWMRIVYCDGIEKEGWIEQTGTLKKWYKPADAAAPTPATAPASTPAVTGPAQAEPAATPSAEPPPAPAVAPPVATPVAPPAADAGTAAAQPAPATVLPAAPGEPCLLVNVPGAQRAAVRSAASTMSPPLDVRFPEEPGADRCARTLELVFSGEVDRSGQRRNRDGAMIMGPVGWLFGAITPWSCPTTYTLDATVRLAGQDHTESYVAHKQVTRVGTMTMCPDAGAPNEAVALELVSNVVGQIAAASQPKVQAAEQPTSAPQP